MDLMAVSTELNLLFSPLYLLLLLPLVVLIFLHKATNSATPGGRNLPPGPFSWPIIGNLPHMLKGPHLYLTQLARSHGQLVSVRFGTHLFVVASSPIAATEIMKTPDRLPISRWVPKAGQDGLQQYSLIWATDCSDHWKLLRSLIRTQLFSAKSLDSQSFSREKNVDSMVNFLNIKEGGIVNIRELVFATTVNILGNIIFSKDFVDLEDDRKMSKGLKRALYRLMKLGTTPNMCDFYPVFEGLDPQGLKKKTSEAMAEAFSVWKHIIKERRATGETLTAIDAADQKDFLDTMLGCGFSDLQINQLTVELFSGGTHSTASTIEFALAELLKNTESMSKLREELKREIGSELRWIKESDVSKLPYLQACVKETLRLHPPAPLLHPQAVLQSCEILNYTIPKNSQLIINVWAMGRDPNLWEDPLTFKPERFCESNVDFKGQDFKFLPFGVGRRMCPGYPYAIKQTHLMLASLVQNFDWFLPNNIEDLSNLDMRENFGIILQRKHPLMVIPKCRR